MLRQLGDGIPFDLVHPVTNAQELIQAQEEIRRIHVSDQVADYIVALADATRSHPQLQLGMSPRATLALCRLAKAAAYLSGRDYVLPEDVRSLFPDVAVHRLILTARARAAHATVPDVMQEVLRKVPGPVLRGG